MRKDTFLVKTIVFIALIFCSQQVFSQTVNDSISKNSVDSTDVSSSKKLKFGMGFGLSFVGGTNISVSPNLIYQMSDKFSFGGGLQFSYNAIKNLQNTTTYGANVLGQYMVVKNLLGTLEFAQLHADTKTETAAGKINKSFWDSAIFVGAGYQITSKISIGAKYNLLYKEDESVYSSPIIPFVNISF